MLKLYSIVHVIIRWFVVPPTLADIQKEPVPSEKPPSKYSKVTHGH